MSKLKRQVKQFFISTNTLFILDKLNYLIAKVAKFSKNKKFKKSNPDFPLPPDYYLFETYILDYKQYKEDGEVTALEILEWTKQYQIEPLRILDWGCGVARVTRHIPKHVDKNSLITGADINDQMIKWNSEKIPEVKFFKINYYPPANFSATQFNLVFALSVFTHIEADFQLKWIEEMYRLISDKGIFLFTTHGKKYNSRLSEPDRYELNTKGFITKSYRKKGHRMMTTYNDPESFKKILVPYFDILEYYDGGTYPEKTGGQDLWIVRKKNQC